MRAKEKMEHCKCPCSGTREPLDTLRNAHYPAKLSAAPVRRKSTRTDRIEGWPRLVRWGSIALLVAVALATALYRVGETGPLWPDAPRYTNGAAMLIKQ